jgi:hypothetical protein
MSNAIKMLICGFESSGKSTIASQLDDAFVLNFDHKEYGFKVPHANIKDYEGLDAMISLITDKVEAYNSKMGKYPKTIVLDTMTQFYTSMQQYNGTKFKGFDEHRQNNLDTLAFNKFIEDSLIPSGINVVIVAHTIYDEPTERHIIPASGAFAKSGSWLSVVNESIFVEKKSTRLVVHTKNLKYPCRTTLQEVKTGVNLEDYSLQDHIDELTVEKLEATDFII